MTDTGKNLLTVNGTELTPDPSGAAYWAAKQTLLVADLHFEKGSAFANRGALLPPYDTSATLAKLANVIDRYEPKRVICVGDSFDDQGAANRMGKHDRNALAALTNAREWVWITGNHDPSPPDDMGGSIVEEFVDGALLFRHEAATNTAPAGEISGHYHPKATITTRGHRHRGPCFVSDGRRLILPSFGAYTGGLSVADPVIRDLFRNGFNLWLIGKKRVHLFPGRAALTTDKRGAG